MEVENIVKGLRNPCAVFEKNFDRGWEMTLSNTNDFANSVLPNSFIRDLERCSSTTLFSPSRSNSSRYEMICLTPTSKVMVVMYEDYHTHLKCIKTILEEFGKLLAFVNIPQNASRYEDLEVVYINKNFGAKDVLAIPEIKNALVKMAFNDGVGISSTTKIEISPKIFFQYYLSREGECICVFGKNVTAEVNERILFEKIINTRNEFMGHISHEIRTPLTGIISTIELIENSGKIPPSLQSYVDTLNICSTSLLTLISDLMDLSKMEAGKLELVHSPFNLRGIVDEVLVYLEGDIKSKGVGMNVVIDQRLSQEFIGDGSRMRQILTNLVNNAVKYNIQNGNVKIKIY